MRKRLLCASLTIALSLMLVMPLSVLAAKPVGFNASGTIDSISTGDVAPAGDSGRWVVFERELGGTLTGDISGDFTFTYKANVDLTTQAGNLHGTVTIGEGSHVLEVNGKIEPLEFAGWFAPGIPLYSLTINGHWTFTDGAKGQGDLSAGAIFVPTPEGHVGFIVDSAFILNGKWQP